jgi:lysine 2,3-aminomutase
MKKVTSHIRSLIDAKNKNCPIRRQFVLTENEFVTDPSESLDPLCEKRYSPLPGLVHRHPDRCLILPTMCCPSYCRFCFRKGMDVKYDFDFKKISRYIKNHKEIDEVIFSGGDPFLLNDSEISSMLKDIDEIKHIRFVRFHTRITLSLPSRVTKSLADILKLNKKQVIVVLHVNHSKELSPRSIRAIKRFIDAGCMVLSQSVLLKQVNDQYEILRELFLKLVENGVKPYYLHQLDRVPGTSHFYVDPKKGRKLMERLRKSIPGVCVPRYVVDTGSKKGKESLF